MADEPLHGLVHLEQPRLASRCGGPGENVAGGEIRIPSLPAQKQVQQISQTVVRNAGVHQDLADVDLGKPGEAGQVKPVHGKTERLPPQRLVGLRRREIRVIPHRGPEVAVLVSDGSHPGQCHHQTRRVAPGQQPPRLVEVGVGVHPSQCPQSLSNLVIWDVDLGDQGDRTQQRPPFALALTEQLRCPRHRLFPPPCSDKVVPPKTGQFH